MPVVAILPILLFSVHLQWFSAGGFPGWAEPLEAFKALLLPALSLAVVQSAILARITRSALLEVLREDFVRTARAKGLSRRQALWGHVLRNAMIPVITVMGLQFAELLAGAIVVHAFVPRAAAPAPAGATAQAQIEERVRQEVAARLPEAVRESVRTELQPALNELSARIDEMDKTRLAGIERRVEEQRKTDLLEAWAHERGLDTHLFLMNGEKFRRGQREPLTGENCGTAQHYLLLDEFYRTGILLAGRLPAWGMVPPPGSRGQGCSFAPRCAAPVDRCTRDRPPLDGGIHRAACWNPAA